jgi:hypothetical protein
MKRAIPISKIGGISKTTQEGAREEFTVHVPSEYDYRYISERRGEIINVLKRQFLELTRN